MTQESGQLREFSNLPNLKSVLGRSRAADGDLARQVREGIRQPLDFPGFGEFLFGGDRIVIAVHSGIRNAELVVGPLLDELLSGEGMAASPITILFADRETADHCGRHLPARDPAIAIVVHEGTSDRALALLGADDSNSPVLVHRLIFDADVIFPIVRAIDDEPHNHPNPMLREFVDSGTKKRWREHIRNHNQSFGKFVRELAGVLIVVNVVMGPGDFPYEVVIGSPAGADAAAARRRANAWQVQQPERLDVILASIDDRRDQESWQAIRDAIVFAAEFDPHVPLVVFSQVAEPPPNELRGVFSPRPTPGANAASFDSALRAAVEGRTIYLCSHLSSDVVHELGMMGIAFEELESLLVRYAHPILLRDPQRAVRMIERAPQANVVPKKPAKKKPTKPRARPRKRT